MGVLKALAECGITISAFAGSSVGAVIAVFAALGYDFENSKNIFANVNLDLFSDLQLNITKDFAISKGERFYNWIKFCIEKKYYGDDYDENCNNPVLFKDLSKDVFVITCNINGCNSFVFSKYTTPDFEIAKAVKISTSLPGLFPPYKFDDKVLIDGDIMKSLPMWKTNPLLYPNDCRIIEFRLEGGKNWEYVKNSVEYINAVFATMSNFATEQIIEQYKCNDKFDYVKIDTEKILPVEFTLPQLERDNLVELGYETTKKYLTNDLLQKKKIILPYYAVILDNLIKIKYLLSDDKIDEAKIHLYELFVYLIDCQKYIDNFIYDEIVSFKNLFLGHLKKKFIFQQEMLKDKSKIEKSLEIIYNEVLERCIELQEYIDEFK